MIELNEQNIPYSLTRKASEIFKLPLMLCSLTYQGFIKIPSYRFLQADVDEWYENDELRELYKSPISYIGSLYDEDQQLLQAIKLVNRYSKAVIFKTYEIAKKYEKSKQDFVLCTAHSSKGLEFDEVVIANDLNDSIADIVGKTNLDADELEALNLYYVSCTRASKALHNAIFLKG